MPSTSLGIGLIDLVVCNLYPFTSDPSIELIDVGGPTMVRAAAKNHDHVAVVVDPADYAGRPRRAPGPTGRSRSTPAAGWPARPSPTPPATTPPSWRGWTSGSRSSGRPRVTVRHDLEVAALLPETIHLTLERAGSLRYGENPAPARCPVPGGRASESWWDDVVQYGGKELSYLNVFDADAAWRLVHELAAGSTEQAVAIIKHANPCGAALDADLVLAYELALECDPQSAFGGIVAIGGPVTVAVAEAITAGPQADVIIAPSYDEDALAQLSSKRKATRLLSAPAPEPLVRQYRFLGASVLVQDADRFLVDPSTWEVATKRQPTDAEWQDLRTAWKVCARTTSNAIAIVTGGQAVGVGAGQQSRVVAAQIAVAEGRGPGPGRGGGVGRVLPLPRRHAGPGRRRRGGRGPARRLDPRRRGGCRSRCGGDRYGHGTG